MAANSSAAPTHTGRILVAELVAPYVYASNVDDERVADLIERIAAGAVDVIAFTSASRVRRLWDVARKRGIEAPLRTGLAHAVVAAVGPVTATEATRLGMNLAIMPSRVYSMKPLVNRRPLHQHGNDGDVPPQGGGYFEPNEVPRGVEAPSPVLVGGVEPVPADQRQQHVAGADMLIDDAAKVATRLDAGNVDKDAIFAATRL